jgi:zinc and cadmium transporter
MDQNFFATLAASLTAGAVTTTGIYTIPRFEAWARQNTTYFACFAAGGPDRGLIPAHRAEVPLP